MSTDQLDAGVTQSRLENQEERTMEGGQSALQTNLALISKKLEDPNFDAAELLRLVTLVMALVVIHMLGLGFTAEEVHIRRCLGQLVNTLRVLGKSIMDTHWFRKRLDVVNWEGEAMKHVVGEMEKWFVESLKESGVEGAERNHIMRHYIDLARVKEPQLRRETETPHR
jgi:hypothetical protein